MDKLTLVVMAAGMGSRYGGLKQVEGVGPGGQTLLDYSVYDALQAGFSRLVFIIRRDIESLFRERVGERFEEYLPVSYACQELDALPHPFVVPGMRTKPWGTGHAVLCAHPLVQGNFAVINADDFYGRDAFARLAGFLAEADPAAAPAPFALVAYDLARTLSAHGGVARGICRVDEDGFLQSVDEHTGLQRHGDGSGPIIDAARDERPEFVGDTPVSMNLWGFTPAVFEVLKRGFRQFLEQPGQRTDAEFYLPAAVDSALQAGEATVRCLRTGAEWHGITYPDDRERVARAIHAKVEAGEYPETLDFSRQTPPQP